MLKDEILVLMSAYNGEKYIKEQIESIENQKLNIPLKILVRDDGSKDNTVDILKELNKKYKNIQILQENNVGCNASFFKLFNIARGYKYYAISDQDDIWLENKLQKGIDEINKEDFHIPVLYGSCSYLMDSSGNIKNTTQKQVRDITLYNTIIQNIIPGHSVIMNDSLLQLLKGDINCDNIYVYDYWITNVAMLYGKVIFSNEPSTKYRIHISNTVGYGKNKIEWIKERLKRFKKGDGEKITKQIMYLYEMYDSDIPLCYKREIENYIRLNGNFFKRIIFIIITKLYRQRKKETIFFKFAFLIGLYKVKE